MEQLGLIDVESGTAIVESAETYVETDYSFDQQLEFARHYGRELNRLVLSPERLHARIWGFADGMSANNSLTSDQKELLRNECFASARSWIG